MGSVGRRPERAVASAVAVEDRGLGQPGEALPDTAGSCFPDALDGQQVLDGGGQQLLEAAEVVDQPVDDAGGEPGYPVEQAVAARADGGVECVGRGGQPVAPGDGGEVQQLGGRQGPQIGEHLVDRPGTTAPVGQVVADEEAAVLLHAGQHLVELEGQQPAVGTELDDET